MDKEDYCHIMGLDSEDIGSVPFLRKFVNKCLDKKGYKKLRGYKSFKQLKAIKHEIQNRRQGV